MLILRRGSRCRRFLRAHGDLMANGAAVLLSYPALYLAMLPITAAEGIAVFVTGAAAMLIGHLFMFVIPTCREIRRRVLGPQAGYSPEFRRFLKRHGAQEAVRHCWVVNGWTDGGETGCRILWHRGDDSFAPNKRFENGIFYHADTGEEADLFRMQLLRAAQVHCPHYYS